MMSESKTIRVLRVPLRPVDICLWVLVAFAVLGAVASIFLKG